MGVAARLGSPEDLVSPNRGRNVAGRRRDRSPGNPRTRQSRHAREGAFAANAPLACISGGGRDDVFGSYQQLLLAVTHNPAMGAYLSHFNNDRSTIVWGCFPDENYAREVIQLFRIGLVEFDAARTPTVDARSEPIATYDNGDITEFAKVFTGPGRRRPLAFFGDDPGEPTLPMVLSANHHEPDSKMFLISISISGGQAGMEGIQEALGLLTNSNVGPFIARRSIQRLVRSNPSPACPERFAAISAHAVQVEAEIWQPSHVGAC